jgi:NAD(P)-dependent dehydrogenase (short-subunit alcohol dehydrogenase family)
MMEATNMTRTETGAARVVIVTGSSSGFGRLTAQTLARRGYTVFATMRGVEGKNVAAAADLRKLAAREGLALQPLELDVTDDASVEHAIGQVLATAGRIDVLVNNAAVGYVGPIEGFTPEQVRAQFETNVVGVLRVNRAVLPQMRRQGAGLLVYVSSGIGRLVSPFVAPCMGRPSGRWKNSPRRRGMSWRAWGSTRLSYSRAPIPPESSTRPCRPPIRRA